MRWLAIRARSDCIFLSHQVIPAKHPQVLHVWSRSLVPCLGGLDPDPVFHYFLCLDWSMQPLPCWPSFSHVCTYQVGTCRWITPLCSSLSGCLYSPFLSPLLSCKILPKTYISRIQLPLHPRPSLFWYLHLVRRYVYRVKLLEYRPRFPTRLWQPNRRLFPSNSMGRAVSNCFRLCWPYGVHSFRPGCERAQQYCQGAWIFRPDSLGGPGSY